LHAGERYCGQDVAQTGATTATRDEALRKRISRDAPEITRRAREAVAVGYDNEARFHTLSAQIIEPWAQALDIPLLVRQERDLVVTHPIKIRLLMPAYKQHR